MHRQPQTTDEWLIYFQSQQQQLLAHQNEVMDSIHNLPCIVVQKRVGELERWRDRVNTSLALIGKIGGSLTVLAGLAIGAWKAFWS